MADTGVSAWVLVVSALILLRSGFIDERASQIEASESPIRAAPIASVSSSTIGEAPEWVSKWPNCSRRH